MRKNAFLLISVMISVFLLILHIEADDNSAAEPISPLPVDGFATPSDKILLGRRLFQDVRFSKNNSISCSSCHDLNHGGDDDKANSIGINGAIGDINSPTVFNSGFNFRQFWNGRAKTLEDQIESPIHHPKEMASSWEEVIQKLKKDAGYRRNFAKSYKDGITRKNIKNAIATFERSLVTPNSRFDRFLKGEKDILTAQEKIGYQRFKSYGCIACHQGMNIGGNMFQTMGIMGNYFEDRGTPITDADLGRYTVTKEEIDKYVFRVPSLRNVDLTAPYFHDGSAKSLEDAVGVMAKYQLGRKLSKKEIDSITAFLKTLTGDMPKFLKKDFLKKDQLAEEQ